MSMSNKERQAAFRARQKAKDFEDAQERAVKAAKHAQRVAEIKEMTENKANPPVSAPDDDLVMVTRRQAALLAQLDELFAHCYIERLFDGSDLALLAFNRDLIERLFPGTFVTDEES
jgi:hypothetical protein